jgi:hypothetical protein
MVQQIEIVIDIRAGDEVVHESGSCDQYKAGA